MSLNLYSLIVKTLTESGQDATLEDIARINNSINNLISRGICKEWLENNIELLL